MATLPTLKPDGGSGKGLEADDAVFGAPVKAHVVRLAVNAHLANRRSGSASTKSRGEVRGGGRKPFRQKGTGRARQGTIRAPHMKGGAITFGPSPKSWSQRLNKKVRRAALTSALSSLASDGAVRVIEDWGITEPKTKEMAALLHRLKLDGGTTLIMLDEPNPAVALSARNLPEAKVVSTEEINVYDLVTFDQVLTTEAGVRAIERALAPRAAAATAEEK